MSRKNYLVVRLKFPILVAVILTTFGCEAGMSEHPYLQQILGIIDRYVPPTPEGSFDALNKEICAIADPDRLNEIVGEKVGEHEVTRQILTKTMDVEPGTPMWVIVRSKKFQWRQRLAIIIESNGKCSARIAFERAGEI
jgi:hypothetical protein